MDNNAEIRKRMKTYRNILLAFVWIGAAIGLIGGFVMMGSSLTELFGRQLIVISIIGGIIGHFFVNVALAIPFILLNNGDILAALVGGNLTAGDTDKTEPPKPTFIPFHAVIEKDTYFKDSLSTRQKTYRTLKAGEKVLVENIIERPDLGGSWAWVTTEQDEHGWCLQDTLAKI